MTYEEYNEMMDEYREIVKKKTEYLYHALKEFLDKDSNDETRKVAYENFRYAIHQCTATYGLPASMTRSNPLSELDLQLYFLIASVKEKLEKEKDFQERIKLMAQEEAYEKVRMMMRRTE